MAAALDQPSTQAPVESLADRRDSATDSAVAAAAPAPNSITPPQSANGKTDAPDGVPSELSDLELDAKVNAPLDPPPVEEQEQQQKVEEKEEDEETEDIEPDHYYGGGRIPIFKPVCWMAWVVASLSRIHWTILWSFYPPLALRIES